MNHSSQPRCKKPRRRRLDFQCGCSAYVTLNCANMGFTHGRETQCTSIQQWRTYLGRTKSPIFQSPRSSQQSIQSRSRCDTPSDAIQPSPQESAGTTQMLHQYQSLDDLTASDLAFLTSL
ncbi:transcriptional activator protein [Parsley yellow leaf curl virus]|nr:transcriptional activator protein [Parsley yellow leaf curl virus]